MRTAVALMLGLGVLALIGTVIAQAPAAVVADRRAYVGWATMMQATYGPWTAPLDALQLFTVFDSIWFRAILALLAVSLVACSARRARGLWASVVRPLATVPAGFFEHASQQASIDTRLDPDWAAGVARSALVARRLRVVVDAGTNATTVYADRHRLAVVGSIALHLSLVVILLGAVLGATAGFRNARFTVPVGSRVDVGAGTGLSVLAVRFSDTYYLDGRPSDYASDLVIFRDGAPVAEQTVRVNEPLRYDGVSFYQSTFGAAAAMSIVDRSGTVLFDGSVPLASTSRDGRRSMGRLPLPGTGLTINVSGAASGAVDPLVKAGQLRVEVIDDSSAAPVASAVLAQGVETSLGDLSITFLREGRFTGLIVARDPGAPLVGLGAALLAIGVCVVVLLPNRRFWVLIEPSGSGSAVQIAGGSGRHAAPAAEFETLVDDVADALSAPILVSRQELRRC
jgi:cytochrome c biogenesis protein